MTTSRGRWRALLVGATWLTAHAAAAQPPRHLRLVVSLEARRLWAVLGADTLLTAPIAVGSDATLAYQGRVWRFGTPPGVHVVTRKDSLPTWVPPEWHYYEVAQRNSWTVRPLSRDHPVLLSDGRRLEVRGRTVGIVHRDSGFVPTPPDEEIVFDGTLFVPPLGTRNREIPGELGRYRLVLGDGYSLHGTPWTESIGAAVTHGCIRLRDDDIAWLYTVVPLGTRVIIH